MKTTWNGLNSKWMPILLGSLFLALRSTQAAIVINEIHYQPANNANHVQFVELFNSGSVSVPLDRWQLT